MSESYPIECPHCHAKGNLADASLLGQAICCPTCQQVFVAPLPVNPAAPAPVIPAPVSPVPVMPVPTPVPDVAPAATVSVPTIDVPPVVIPAAGAVPAAGQPVQPPQSPDVAASSPPPAAAWKFGAAPEEVLATSAVPVVTVAIAPANPLPVDSTSVAAASVVPAVMPQLSPVPAAVPVVAYAPPVTTGMPQEFPVPTMPGQVNVLPVPGQMAPPTVGQFPAQLMAPPPTGHYLPTEPFAGVNLPPVHEMDGPVPGFMAPAPPPGVAELSFAQSLPEPVARGAIQPPKPTSKANQNLIIGGISAILLFAAIVFLMGDPFRRFGKTKPPEEPAEMNPIAKPYVPQPGDTTAEDAFARINALNNPKPDKK